MSRNLIEVLFLKTVLEYLQQEFLNVVELMSDGVFIADLNYKVLYINTAYGKFANLKREEIIGKNIYDVRPGGFLPKLYVSKQPIYNVPRRVDNTESYCDYLPITIEGRLIGGMVIVKDALRVKELSAIVEENAEKISQLNSAVNDAFSVRTHFADLVGANSGLKSVVELGCKAAKSDSYVLLLGESGTGKDVIAQAIHNDSNRKNRPFIDVNCAALPETLLESELFGYVGGAFTGANKHGKTGLFELADGGTIFLDEIAEIR
jgi:transcriptional regulator with PAS, ATPase and Fis domain